MTWPMCRDGYCDPSSDPVRTWECGGEATMDANCDGQLRPYPVCAECAKFFPRAVPLTPSQAMDALVREVLES